MNDTVSAATALAPEGIRLTFLVPSEPAQSPEWSAVHIPGSVHGGDTGPGLIVNFMTLTPDAAGWAPAPAADQAGVWADTPSPTVSGYAAIVPDDPSPGIVGALSAT